MSTSLPELSAPAGDFTLNAEDKRPVVLLSGGVGLTPMISMLNTLVNLNENRNITFLHASPNGQSHAFRDYVDSLAKRNPGVKAYYRYTQPEDADRENEYFHKEGYMDAIWLRQVIDELDSTYYLCGPVSFMRGVYTELQALGVAADNIHYEFFGPKASLSPAPESV
ncbi:hypothetical protein [Paenibacillus sp. PAMC 26794]|uniref:hypothetical protein n=1 Tax=Paenibacillus sp. PAMC 26794 TaxID=1257080 RepID=UPI0002F7EE87|nr:hypothetical protein [Paenibacillus sp. PAMC 26794]